jgi:hypothetical protein
VPSSLQRCIRIFAAAVPLVLSCYAAKGRYACLRRAAHVSRAGEAAATVHAGPRSRGFPRGHEYSANPWGWNLMTRCGTTIRMASLPVKRRQPSRGPCWSPRRGTRITKWSTCNVSLEFSSIHNRSNCGPRDRDRRDLHRVSDRVHGPGCPCHSVARRCRNRGAACRGDDGNCGKSEINMASDTMRGVNVIQVIGRMSSARSSGSDGSSSALRQVTTARWSRRVW